MRLLIEKPLDIAIIFTINTLFIGLCALLLWPLGGLGVAWRLAQGYLLLWLATFASILLLFFIEWLTRVNMDDHFYTYIALGIVGSLPLSAGWGAFAAFTIHTSFYDAVNWQWIVGHVVGLLSAYIAVSVISAFFSGTIYKLVNLPVAVLAYLLFAIWPAVV
jgi:hypothetical protein